VANMSHELRTPLNAVIGFAEIMRGEMMGPLGSATYLDYAKVIGEAGHRLLAIVNDILELAAVEIGCDRLEDTVIDLDELAHGLVNIVHGRAESGRVTVTVRPMTGPPLLRGDGPRIKRILMNLLTNGVTFTPPGGKVEIAAERRPDGGLAVAISDTGIGIAAADIARLMHPFTLGEDVYSRRYQGQGLGLPIAQRLAELHGGGLSLASEPGRGTTATVTFPPERVLAEKLSQDSLRQIID